MKTSKKINFVLNIDNGYIQQATVTMTSILLNLNTNWEAHFYIFFKGCKNKPKEFLLLEKQFHCFINCIDVTKHEAEFTKLNLKSCATSWISISAYYRIFMFKYLPHNVKYAIYLDADMIVDGDLSTIYNKFIINKWFFASVADIYFYRTWHRERCVFSKYKEFNKLVLNRSKYAYFCDGFYIANIKECQKRHVYEQSLEFLKKHPNPKYADQDVLNAIFSQKYSKLMTYLDPSYDVLMYTNPIFYKCKSKYFYSKQSIKNAFDHPIVRHYAGPNKPWKNNKCHFGCERWWYYHDKSPASMPKFKF